MSSNVSVAWNDYCLLCGKICINHPEVMYKKNGEPNTQLEQERNERNLRARYFESITWAYSLSDKEKSDLRLLARGTKYDF